MFQKYVHNNPDYTNENLDYGKIKLPKDKRCPFLDEENYCIIFKNIAQILFVKRLPPFPHGQSFGLALRAMAPRLVQYRQNTKAQSSTLIKKGKLSLANKSSINHNR